MLRRLGGRQLQVRRQNQISPHGNYNRIPVGESCPAAIISGPSQGISGCSSTSSTSTNHPMARRDWAGLGRSGEEEPGECRAMGVLISSFISWEALETMTPKNRTVLIMCTRCSGTGIALQQRGRKGLHCRREWVIYDCDCTCRIKASVTMLGV